MRWSAPLAYAVGVITTDGYLSSDNRHISVTSSDYQLLEAFRQSLNKTNKIGINPPSNISKKTAFRIQVGDIRLYRWLESIGLSTNKSLTVGEIKVPDNYLMDFLRGHLDGDGSIIYYKDYYNTHLNPKYIYDRLFVCFLSSSENHILWLRRKIKEYTNLRGSLSRHKPRSQLGKSESIRLKYSTKEAKILLNLIYYNDDLPCLNRKYLIAKPFLNRT